MIEVGQVYASTHRVDVAHGCRQRREVVRVEGCFVWLRTLDGERRCPASRVRLRADATRCRTIPGHRLVLDSTQGRVAEESP